MENLTQETITILIIASLIALVIGFFIGRATKGIDTSTKDAISDAQKQLDDYKKEVSEHFGKTADLVDNLTQSYKDVFDHLGVSAKTLLTEEQVNEHLASRADKAITLTYAGDTGENVVETVNKIEPEQSKAEKEEEQSQPVDSKNEKTAIDTQPNSQQQTTDKTKETTNKASGES